MRAIMTGGAMAADGPAYEHGIAGADACLPGQGDSLETDSRCVDVDAITFAGFHYFGIAGDDGDAGLFSLPGQWKRRYL